MHPTRLTLASIPKSILLACGIMGALLTALAMALAVSMIFIFSLANGLGQVSIGDINVTSSDAIVDQYFVLKQHLVVPEGKGASEDPLLHKMEHNLLWGQYEDYGAGCMDSGDY